LTALGLSSRTNFERFSGHKDAGYPLVPVASRIVFDVEQDFRQLLHVPDAGEYARDQRFRILETKPATL
jgi:hypothetical protein